MRAVQTYFSFVTSNAPFLAAGALLMLLSSFGQTFFISIFGGDIRQEFQITNGEWGVIYMVGTMISAIVMLVAGSIIDHLRARFVGVIVTFLLAMSCVAMAKNVSTSYLIFAVLALRFFGQGMIHHVSIVAMSRWFIAERGRALAVASLGFMLAEATFPVFFVWLKSFFDWRSLWLGCGGFVLLMCPVLLWLLRLERSPSSISDDNSSVGMDGRHWSRADALRHPLFWALIPAIMLFPAFGTAFWFHQVHFAEIKDWDHLSLVAVFPLGTFSFMAFTFFYGAALDRFGPARLFPFYLLPLVIGFALHAFAPTVHWSAAGVVFQGMAGGGAATLPAAVWATYFGTKNLGSIKSAVAAAMVLGSAIGPGLSGWLIDFGIGFETQLLFYAGSFLFAAGICIAPLKAATKRLPIST